MTALIAMLSTGKGTWTEVARLINAREWTKIILITDEFGEKTFKKSENTELIIFNIDDSIESLIIKFTSEIKDKLEGNEVALNFASGNGKEHMALLSSLLKLGLGIRLITFSNNALKEI